MVRVQFTVSYLTVWGQRLLLCAYHVNGAATVFTSRHEMSCRWEGKRLLWDVTLAFTDTPDLQYKQAMPTR